MSQLSPVTDVLEVVEDEPREARAAPAQTWKVLVVDDDAEVHEATRFALAGRTILGRKLELLFANTAAEAKAALDAHAGVAVVLLDVVMEEHDTGLKLARWIRDNGYRNVRIVLRTGQPGYAPELEVINEYDINDYRSKAELTRTRLITTMTAALRAYEQIETIDLSRRGLEMIVTSCSQLFKRRELATFSQGVLLQMCSLFRLPGEGMICAGTRDSQADEVRVLSGIGTVSELSGRTLDELDDEAEAKSAVLRALRDDRAISEGASLVTFDGAEDDRFVTYMEGGSTLTAIDEALLKVFAANISVGFQNVGLIARLDRLAYFDEELSIANRNRLNAEIAARIGSNRPPARVAFVSVASYEQTLEAFGQETALGLLKAVVRRLEEAPGAPTLFRYGEAILALILEEGDEAEEALRALGTEQFDADGQALRAKFAIGVAPIAPFRAPSFVCHEAYAALSRALNEDLPWVDFEAELIHEARARLELTSALRQSVDGGEIASHFQPIVDLDSELCLGAEALARWSWNEAPVGPDIFIPVAEQTGLAFPIMTLMLGAAARLRALVAARHTDFYVSINLSATDLERPDLVAEVEAMLAEHALPARLVQFELTESCLVRNLAKAQNQLGSLKELGCRIAIDDFGIGYSSLAYLDQLPVDTLKLDGRFVASLGSGGRSQAVISSALELGQRLGIDVLAEGVETARQHRLLKELGCRRAQGYYYAKPMPSTDFVIWLDSNLGGAL
ncbi:MAG: EAL domain-containing protein [Alphaproteobacteria bacterium]|nr:EAL domain-containing protein [Alphaproteobacteria bacterium]